MSQNNIRNNQNFNICNTTRRNGSTNNIKRKVKPGGSTLSRSIFAFLENRDNTNVDSNPTKTSMNLKKIWLKENFQIGPMPPPRCLASPDTWPPTDRARDRRGRFGGLQVHQEGELLEDVQLSLKHQHQLIQTSCLPARFSSALHFCPPCPPPPCCPSIIRIFSPHLLDTCMNEEIDK